jgi:ketosteroid isomerase-like protein
MTDAPLPAPIATFIDTTNAGDSDGFVAAFTDDAVLVDWGREFHGREGAAAWNQTDNIGRGAHFEVVDWQQGTEPDTYVVTITVSGGGFNGTGPIEFAVRDGLLSRMTITPA